MCKCNSLRRERGEEPFLPAQSSTKAELWLRIYPRRSYLILLEETMTLSKPIQPLLHARDRRNGLYEI